MNDHYLNDWAHLQLAMRLMAHGNTSLHFAPNGGVCGEDGIKLIEAVSDTQGSRFLRLTPAGGKYVLENLTDFPAWCNPLLASLDHGQSFTAWR